MQSFAIPTVSTYKHGVYCDGVMLLCIVATVKHDCCLWSMSHVHRIESTQHDGDIDMPIFLKILLFSMLQNLAAGLLVSAVLIHYMW